MANFYLKFMINGMILILNYLISHFMMEMSHGVLLLQLIRFARVCSNVSDFSNRNQILTAKLLKKGYTYHKSVKHFLNYTTHRVYC